MSKSIIYEPLPEGARPVAAWWALFQLFLMFILSLLGGAIAALVVALTGVAIAILNGSFDPASGAEPPMWLIGLASIGFMVGLFISLTACAIIKIKMEKRSLASAGLGSFLYGPKFWGGFASGAGLALILGIPAGLAALVFGVPEPEAVLNMDHVLTPGFAITVVCIFLFVLIQAPAEEIMMRGWMLSALSWRHGLGVGVVVSSVLFSLLHMDRLVAGVMWGVYTLIAVGAVGVLFAATAYARRSVLPAAGMHTGYNFTLITLGVGYLLAQSEDGNILSALEGAFDMASLPAFEFSPVTIIDMLARGAIPLVIALWLFSRKRRDLPWQTQLD